METFINERIRIIAEKFFKGNTSAMARIVFVKQATLRDIISEKVKPSYDTIRQIVECSTLNINSDWLITGKGKMLKSAAPTAIPDDSGIPLYRTEAAAGFGNENFSIEEKDIEARYKIKELESASFMLHIRGDSMSPTYNNGDVIAVQRVRDNRNIQWGKPHLVSSKPDGLLVKRIYDDEGDIIAVSDNPTYKPIHIRKDDVTGIAIVKGFVRFENY